MIQEETQELRDMVGALLKQAQDKKEDLVSSTTDWDQEELISKKYSCSEVCNDSTCH